MRGSEVIWLPGRGGRRHDEEPLPTEAERVTHDQSEHWITVLCAAGRPPAVRRGRADQILKRWTFLVLTNVGEASGQEVVLFGHPLEPAFLVEFRGEDHAERAVRTAEWMRRSLALLQERLPEPERYGVASGLASAKVVRLVLTSGPVRWLGGALSAAVRLQEFAGPGQVFLAEETRQALSGEFRVFPLGEIGAEHDWGRRAFCLMAVVPEGTRPGGPRSR